MDHQPLRAAGTAIELYGSFQLAQFELALPVCALQEVVNYPARVTQVPQAPPHLLGLFNLRGTLIPIVDPRPLLGLPSSGEHARGKIAVVELDDMRVGLLFDATGEILRVPAEQKIDFDTASSRAPVVCGALKLDGGDRILQILSSTALLGLPQVPRQHPGQMRLRQEAQRAQRRQTVSFRVGQTYLALPMAAIREIIRVPALQLSPLADEHCIGMLNLRGNTVPVIDFARFMGLAPGAEGAAAGETCADQRRIVVLQQDDAYFGLMVAEVCSIIGYRDDKLLPMPAYAKREVALFAGCLGKNGHENIILLNPDALFGNPQLTAIVRGHRALFHAASADTGSRQRGRGARETYVTFRLGQLLGVRIGQLSEVIDYPDEIVKTPGAPAFVLGVLNLRRELITVFDVRALLGMPPYPDLACAKVLIVRHGDEKCGLVVDAVDNIVTLADAERIPIPAVMKQRLLGGLRDTLKEAVEIPGTGMLVLIDLMSLCEQTLLACPA